MPQDFKAARCLKIVSCPCHPSVHPQALHARVSGPRVETVEILRSPTMPGSTSNLSLISTCSSSSAPSGANKCKWCLRSFESENPIVGDRVVKPTLQRRAPRSSECYTCPRVIAQSYPDGDRKDFESALRTTPDLFTEFLGAVRKREQMVNAGVPLPRRNKREADTGEGESDEEVDGPLNKIEVAEWGAVRMQRAHGHLLAHTGV